eukprot:1111301-Rhodomonas_salina.3
MSAVALVTGGGRGIGLQLVNQLLPLYSEVVVTCRQRIESNGKFHVIDGVDLSKPESASERVVQYLTERKFNVNLFVNNAGCLTRHGLDDLDVAMVSEQFTVNALAPLILTNALLQSNLYAPNAKVAIISSLRGSIARNSSGGMYGYSMSKAAANAAGKSLAIDLAPKGIAVGMIHPGYVQTDMTEGKGDISTEVSARGIIQRIQELSTANAGRFVDAVSGDEIPW